MDRPHYVVVAIEIRGMDLRFENEPKGFERILKKALRKLNRNVDQEKFRVWAFGRKSFLRTCGLKWEQVKKSDIHDALMDIWSRLCRNQLKYRVIKKQRRRRHRAKA